MAATSGGELRSVPTSGGQGLTPGEERLLAELVDGHGRVMVLRAEAVALLQGRGRDVRERVARA